MSVFHIDFKIPARDSVEKSSSGRTIWRSARALEKVVVLAPKRPHVIKPKKNKTSNRGKGITSSRPLFDIKGVNRLIRDCLALVLDRVIKQEVPSTWPSLSYLQWLHIS
jgi:hypothetical protein